MALWQKDVRKEGAFAMSYKTLIKDIKSLPVEGYDVVVQYVEFLTFKFKKSIIQLAKEKLED